MTADKPAQQGYKLEPGEKVTSIMAYTDSALVWGDVITKEAIRVSTWLRTQAVPQYIYIHNASILRFGSVQPKPVKFREIHLPSAQVIAYHIAPPTSDPLDYDPKEPMRKLEPVSAMFGWFRFDGCLRMSTATTVERFLDVAKETFTSMYDLTITVSAIQGMNPIKVPYAMIRSTNAIFAPRDV
jgi:hypothetical protein